MTREAGSLPLEGTSLNWELLKVIADGNDVVLDSSSNYQEDFVTPENGVVTIPLKVDDLEDLESNAISGHSKLALRIRPSKESTGSFAQVGGTKGHCTDAANNVNYNYLSLGGMTSLEDCQQTCLKPNHKSFVGVEFSEGAEKICNCLHSGSSLPQCTDFYLLDPTIGDAGGTCRRILNTCGGVAAEGPIVALDPNVKIIECGRRRLGESPASVSDGNFTFVGDGKCQDLSGELFSNIMMHVSQTEFLPDVSSQVEICSSRCFGFGTDGLVGFAHAHKANQAAHFCFCYYDQNAILPPMEATSTNFASYGKGQGPVASSDGRQDHVCYEYTPPLPSVSPSSSPTASPTSPTVSPTPGPTQTSYFSDTIFSFVGLGRCLDGQGVLVSVGANHSVASVGDCSYRCIDSMDSRFVGFHYNHADENCACLYSDNRVESADIDNADGEVCFKYIGNWPTTSPTTSPRPTTPPSMSPSTSPTSAPSGSPTSRPSQPPRTEDNFFDFVGMGRCLDSENLEYIVRTYSKSDRDTRSANRCGEICRAHMKSSEEFIVGFEVTEGVSCECLISQDVIVERPTIDRRRLDETKPGTALILAERSSDAALDEELTTRKLNTSPVSGWLNFLCTH